MALTLSLLPSSPGASKGCGNGWPGSAYWYCMRNAPGLHVRTWVLEDEHRSRVEYEVCDFDARYTGQRLYVQPGWATRWGYRTLVRTQYTTPLVFAPTAEQPCAEWILYELPPDWQHLPPYDSNWQSAYDPDIRRVYPAWLPYVTHKRV